MRERQPGQLGDGLAGRAGLGLPEVDQVDVDDDDGLVAVAQRERRGPERQIDAGGALVRLRAPAGVCDPDRRRDVDARHAGCELAHNTSRTKNHPRTKNNRTEN